MYAKAQAGSTVGLKVSHRKKEVSVSGRPKDDRSDNCYSFFGRLGLIV
jgi:hypothetical protein